MEFVSLVPPSSTKPPSQRLRAVKRKVFGPLNVLMVGMIRDQLTISSWLAIGACIQGVLFLLIGRLALAPAMFLLLYRVAKALAQANGLRHNPYMDGVIMNKYSAQLPGPDGTFGAKPANGEVVVFLLGARINHPLGPFGPGVKELGDFAKRMYENIEDRAEDYGLLGMSSWIINGERDACNEQMSVFYFKNVEGLHKFAHGDIHREGWDWWNRTYKKHPHIAIYHEVYSVPAGRWETIYANSHPTLLGATTHRREFFDPADEKAGSRTAWFSPIVDARKGLLRTSAGRMAQSKGTEHEKYGYDEPDAAYAA